MIPYQAFAAHLQKISVLASPAELHAHAVGFLCVNKQFDSQRWLSSATEDYCVESTETQSINDIFSAVFEHSKEQLNKDNHGFELLLPDENSGMSERLSVLADWINTFLAALGLAGFSQAQSLSKECTEFISDLNKIAQVEKEADNIEGEELDFMEITEYIRAGVMMLYLELNAGKNPSF